MYTLAVSSAFTLLAFTRTILKGLDTSHTHVCTCCRGRIKRTVWATMYGVKIDTPTCCWVLGLQYTCKAPTRCGGRSGHSDVKPNGFVWVSRKNITWCFSLTSWLTAAAKVWDRVVYGSKLEHCLHFDNLSSFVHSQAIERKDNIKENINFFLQKWHFIIGNEFLFENQILWPKSGKKLFCSNYWLILGVERPVDGLKEN